MDLDVQITLKSKHWTLLPVLVAIKTYYIVAIKTYYIVAFKTYYIVAIKTYYIVAIKTYYIVAFKTYYILFSISAIDDKQAQASPIDVEIIVCSGCSGHGSCVYNVTRDPDSESQFNLATCDCNTGWQGQLFNYQCIFLLSKPATRSTDVTSCYFVRTSQKLISSIHYSDRGWGLHSLNCYNASIISEHRYIEIHKTCKILEVWFQGMTVRQIFPPVPPVPVLHCVLA